MEVAAEAEASPRPAPLVALAAMYVGFCIVGVAGMILLPLAVLVVKQLHDGGFVGLWR